MDGNPYAQPASADPPESAADAQYPRKALRIAGAVMALFALLRGFEFVTGTTALLRVLGRESAALYSTMTWIRLTPLTARFAIPALLAIALLMGRPRFRKLAWIYAVAVSVLSLALQVLAQSFSPQVMPMTFVVAFLAQQVLFAVAIGLLLVGRAGSARVVAGTVMGVLYGVSVFGLRFL